MLQFRKDIVNFIETELNCEANLDTAPSENTKEKVFSVTTGEIKNIEYSMCGSSMIVQELIIIYFDDTKDEVSPVVEKMNKLKKFIYDYHGNGVCGAVLTEDRFRGISAETTNSVHKLVHNITLNNA